MATLSIIPQVQVIPKAGGVFYYNILSDVDIRWSETTWSIPSGLTITTD